MTVHELMEALMEQCHKLKQNPRDTDVVVIAAIDGLTAEATLDMRVKEGPSNSQEGREPRFVGIYIAGA